ncbi:MAG: hypothetical protein L6R37_000008 [Teloschistes peruensis]|nr:MAG: hypothetical protein L6R37_000008 [Teloschistes peruensis]
MRQRGAGARDIQLSFDLEIPGLPKHSRSPLKPQKSAENRQLPPPDLSLSLKPPQTPNGTVSNGLSSFKSLSTAKKLGSAVPDPDTERSNQRIPQDQAAIETVQPIKRGKPGRKRKIAPASAEDDDEVSKVNWTKIQNNKLLTGHSPSHATSQSFYKTGDPTNVGNTSSVTATTNVSKPDATKPAVEQNLEQVEQSLDITKTDGRVQRKKEVPKETRTRKRKPNEQTQRPKKKPKIILPDLQEKAINETVELKESLHKQSEDLLQGAEVEPTVEEPSKHARAGRPKKDKSLPQTSAVLERTNGERSKENVSEQIFSHLATELAASVKEPKKRGRKPKVLLDGVTEPAQGTTQDPVLDTVTKAPTIKEKPKKRGQKPKILSDERMKAVKDSIQAPVLDAVSKASTTDEKPKKRGRKPKIVPIDEVEPPADKHNREVMNSGETHEEAFPPREVQPQSSEGLPATKPKVGKKETVSQARKSRKQTVAVPLLEQLPETTTDDAEAEPKNDSVKTKAARKPPRKALSKETLIPPATVVEPGKATSDEPPEIGRHAATTQVSVIKTRNAPVEKEQEDPQTVKIPKKRGRPKKIQPSESETKPTEPGPEPQEEILEETNPQKTHLDQEVTAPTELPAATEPTPSTIPPQPANEPPQAEPKKKRGRPKKQQPSTTLPAAETTSDRQPVAHQTKVKPKSSTITNNSRIAKASTAVPKAPRRLRLASISYKDSLEDEDEGNASDDPISEHNHVGPKKTSGLTLEAIDDAPLSTIETLPAIPTDDDIQPHPNPPHIPAVAVLQPPTQSTDQDHKAVKTNLVETAKSHKPSDAQTLPTSTSTSTHINNNNKKLPTITTRGLENFVFSRVGRNAKAKTKTVRTAAAGEGEELDPELQGLFDQVKGISSRGGGVVR